MTREQERQELYKTIWQIANDLRGSVDGWDFKAYVLGMLAYRYLSESLAGEFNRGEREAGAVDFDYARQDECLEGQDRLNFVQNRGYYIEPGLLFENVMQCGEDELNIRLDKALRQIEASGEGTGAAKMFEGLFTDMDLNSNKLCVIADDADTLKSLLTPGMQALPDIDQQIGDFLEFVQGDIISRADATGGVSYAEKSEGRTVQRNLSGCADDIKTDSGHTYRIRHNAYNISADEPDEIGVFYISIVDVDSYDDENGYPESGSCCICAPAEDY